MSIDQVTQAISEITALPGITDNNYRPAVDNLVEAELPQNSTELETMRLQLNTSISKINTQQQL